MAALTGDRERASSHMLAAVVFSVARGSLKLHHGIHEKNSCLLLLCTAGVGYAASANNYAAHWVWISGWNLKTDGDVAEITKVLESGAAHGINGAVHILWTGFVVETMTADFSRRLDEVQRTCEHLKIELFPGGASASVMAARRYNTINILPRVCRSWTRRF